MKCVSLKVSAMTKITLHEVFFFTPKTKVLTLWKKQTNKKQLTDSVAKVLFVSNRRQERLDDPLLSCWQIRFHLHVRSVNDEVSSSPPHVNKLRTRQTHNHGLMNQD